MVDPVIVLELPGVKVPQIPIFPVGDHVRAPPEAFKIP